MTSVSKLAHLYEAVFKTPPSSQTKADLLAMEEIFGLVQDDALSRMLIVLLRLADRIEEAGQKRSETEGKFTADMSATLSETNDAVHEIKAASTRIHRRRFFGHQAGWVGAPPIEVDTYRRRSPLLSYLACAFRPLRGVLDEDERTRLARWDVFLLVGVMSLLIVIAAGLGYRRPVSSTSSATVTACRPPSPTVRSACGSTWSGSSSPPRGRSCASMAAA